MLSFRMIKRSKLVKYNRIFVYFCAWWASLANELHLPHTGTVGSIECITIIWSIIIFITNLCKFFNVHEHCREAWPSCDKLLLNYLPRLGEFGKLYYGLSSVSTGAPLVWRLYLAYFKPLRSYAATSAGGDAAARLVRFFMFGPQLSIFQHQQQQRPQQHQVHLVNQISDELLAGAFTTISVRCNKHICTRNNRTPLAIAHESHSGVAKISGFDRFERKFQNPIRAGWYEDDLSEERWSFIALYFYTFGISSGLLAVPITFFTIRGLQSVLEIFADPELILAYGILEILYVCGQSVMLYGFTNYFITLFYADLVFKIKQISSSLDDLCDLYKYSTGPGKSGRTYIFNLQLLIWQYFDTLSQYDRFVSKYSAVSIVTFIIGLSFSQSCLRVGESSLQQASIAVLTCIFTSFTFLYILSSDIEQKSTRLHTTILSIIARDPDFATKRAWQRTLLGFYQSDGRRTFTMDNQYPLDLYSYFKTVFGILTMSLVMSRLFHKRSWEGGFNIIYNLNV